jgi:ElaB/YqjD/DUF883 family membrane-anchored ribosome-binding protein
MSTPLGVTNTESAHGVKALQQSKDKLVADLKLVVDDAQALLKEAMDTSAEGIHAVPAYLEDRLNAVKGNLQRVKGAIESKAKQATTVTHVYVQENPWKSLGIVAAVSVMMSILLVGAVASAAANHRRD